MNYEASCVISGSFTKAKEKIDRIRECFIENEIRVLSPAAGGLFLPDEKYFWSRGAFPLKSELNMSELQAKKKHINAIQRADFLYIVAQEGYIGESVSFEAGVAICINIPIYCSEEIDFKLDTGENWKEHLRYFQVKSPEEVAKIWKPSQTASGLWLPKSYLIK